MRTKFLSLLITFFTINLAFSQEKFTISGFVKDAKNGEELIGASVFIKNTKYAVNTNEYGFYSITIPKGNYSVNFSFVGYITEKREIELDKSKKIDIELLSKEKDLKEVVITSEGKKNNIESIEMSTTKLNVERMKKLPTFLGEVDIMKNVLLLPGIQSGGEGSSGIYVRGGGSDQNLILLDEAPVYNASHLLGFFSVFNSDAIKDLKVYKGGIPAEYGGRLSSLIDIMMKEGNSKKISATGGIGNISSRLTIEGPIIKDKMSFIISGRRTYGDWLGKLAGVKELKDNSLYFYDLNGKINYKIGEKDRIFFSNYFGKDVFGFNNLFKINWGNTTSSLRWNHIFHDKLFVNTTGIASYYNYKLNVNGGIQFEWYSKVRNYELKTDWTYYRGKNILKFGLEEIYGIFDPGTFDVSGNYSSNYKVAKNYSLNNAFYISNENKIGGRIDLQYGVRISMFNLLGSGTVYQYKNGVPNYIDSEGTIKMSDTTDAPTIYKMGELIKTYYGIEPRLSAKYSLNEVSSIKFSYNRTRQNIHLVSNTNSPTPFDVWVPSGKYIKPQIADQVAVGYFRNFKNDMFETSAEVYYKDMQNQIDYKDGADIFLNKHIETELRIGKAYSYGLEMMIKKNEGKFTGTLSYTLSKTRKKTTGINEGKEYPATYDRTHDISFVAMYELNEKWTFGGNWVFSTGAAVTYPNAKYQIHDSQFAYYSDRNAQRIPSYHRLDLSATLTPRKNKNRKWKESWNFSLYNVYMRKNAYSIYFQENPEKKGEMQAVQLSIIGTVIPSVTYNFNF